MSPGAPKKATTDQVVSAYREHGSVWKAARTLGMSGQAVWERLRSIGYPMRARLWTAEEKAELVRMVAEMPLGKIAEHLGRPYAGVACMASRLGVCQRIGNRLARRIPRGAGYNQQQVTLLVRDLRQFKGSLRQFARARGLGLTTMVEAIKRRDPAFWEDYSRARGLAAKECPGCGGTFFPMSSKQASCSTRCSYRARADREYFGGKRATTVGLREGMCQLCGRRRTSGLHSHHVFGKEHDPGNDVLVAVCPGCHAIIGRLARMTLCDSSHGWETLIHLVAARRAGAWWKAGKFHGTYVTVEIEHLTEEEAVDLADAAVTKDYGDPPRVEIVVEGVQDGDTAAP